MSLAAGQNWKRKKDGAAVRVMAIVEGWVMVRVPHCVPFLVPGKEFAAKYKETDT